MSAELPRLRVEGNRIVDAAGEKVVLRGVNIADPENICKERPRVRIQDVVKGARNLGCRIIRIPVLPEELYGWKFGFLHQKEDYFSKYLLPAVDCCAENKLYAIIDMHYVDCEDYGQKKPLFGYLEKKDQATEFWSFIAPRFKHYTNVIFEIYNEPVQPFGSPACDGCYDWSIWKNQMAQPLVDLIRDHAPDNLIFVGGPNYCLEMHGAAIDPVTDRENDPPSIVYVTHSYPSHCTKYRIAKVLDPIVEKVPVFVSEWGFELGAGRTVHGTAGFFGEEVMEYVQKHEIGWTAWIYDNLVGCRMVDAKWELLGDEDRGADEVERNGRMGGFVKRHLKP